MRSAYSTYDPHAVAAIIVGEIAQNPDAWMSHVHNGGNPLRCANPQHRNRSWIRNGIAVEGDNLERVTRQAKLRISVALPFKM